MAEPAVGQVVDGRYQLEELIGRGGMGQVFRARHVFTHQLVAVKVITDGLDADTMQRFLAEARAASTIGHPAIVEVSDANRTSDGQLYLVMELLAGKPLRVAMTRGLSTDDVKRIGLELLDALGAAHARGVIHRDLKPENIYLVAPTGALKVLDFGIAKVLGTAATTHGRVLGTLEYMAPEQLVAAAEVDGRADLWSVGVILYELITGVRPYAGLTREELFHALADQEPTPITAVAQVTPDVAGFFAAVLARDPAKRFAHAHAMAAALRRLNLVPQAISSGAPLGTGVAVSSTAPPIMRPHTSSAPPAQGTGEQRPRSGSAPPGPTMGTGDAWVRPVSQPPVDEPRAKSSSAPPGPTLGTGDAWIRPVSQPPPDDGVVGAPRPPPGSIPPEDQRRPAADPLAPTETAPAYIHRAPPAAQRRRRRAILVGVLGVGVIGGAIAIGVVAASRSGPAGASAEQCEAACKKLAGCGLDPASCKQMCGNQLDAACVENASGCTAMSSCVWNATCGHAPAGTGTCGQAMKCHATCNGAFPCLCTCNAQMNPTASLLMAKLMTCQQRTKGDDPRFMLECGELAVACQEDLPGKSGPSNLALTSDTPAPPKPDRATCQSVCARLATCELAMPSCVQDCELGRFDVQCIASESKCDALARCHWKRHCGRPIKSGSMGCMDGASCYATKAGRATGPQCDECLDKLTPLAATQLAAVDLCRTWMSTQSIADPHHFDGIKAYEEHCKRPEWTCYGYPLPP